MKLSKIFTTLYLPYFPHQILINNDQYKKLLYKIVGAVQNRIPIDVRHIILSHNSCIIYRLNTTTTFIHKFMIMLPLHMLNNIIFSTMLSSIMNQKAINFLAIIFNIFINETKFYCYLILHCMYVMGRLSQFIIRLQYAATEDDNVICVLTEKRQNFNNILSWI